jgi:serine/threonine-protein kinase
MEHTAWCDARGWVGRWETAELLGAGKDCTAYVARAAQGPDRSDYILKALCPGRGIEAVWNLQKEARALEALDHPRIPRLVETNLHPRFNLEERTPYLVVEHVPGVTLRELVGSRGPQDDEVALTMVDRLLDAMAHCHERGWVHGDMRPANIVLRDGDPLEPVLIDFKSSKNLLAPPNKPSSRGTRTAPRSPSSDLTHVGCILLFALTGKLPLGPRDWHLRAPHELSRDKGGLDGLEGERIDRLWTMFDRAFTVDARHRFGSAREMQAAVRHAQAAPPATPRSDARPPKPEAKLKMHRPVETPHAAAMAGP